MAECRACGKFFPDKQGKRSCSRKCKQKAYAKPITSLHKEWGVNTGTSGAIAELMVSSDLLQQGFEVFRALSPASSSDLLAFKLPIPAFRIQVRIGQIRAGKKVGISDSSLVHEDYEILAIVYPDLIVYKRSPFYMGTCPVTKEVA